jgi:hypothetical protein
VEEARPAGIVEILEYFHSKLDVHFRLINRARQALMPAAPVFALEHDLSEGDLELVKKAVRAAVAQGFGPRFRQWWLPFVVYAAELGYDYAGGDYWPSFEAATPSWHTHGERYRLKMWYVRFADDYGGAVPTGAFAEHFTIISWPITHAVLPVYLQRQLVQLLHGFRTGLTTELLDDPAALGGALASRAVGYTERFRIFCENKALLGQVAAALLAGEGEESPYLTPTTLGRLTGGLRESEAWMLRQIKQSAIYIRKSGFRSQGEGQVAPRRKVRLPAPTDPSLLLRREDGAWRAYARLPDLTSLQARLPHLYDELRVSRAQIAGMDGKLLASGRLTYPGQEVRFTSWPRRDVPFIQLEQGSDPVNALIADQCVISPGPWWLFRSRPGAPAAEVKGKFVRPGHSYYLIGEKETAPPLLPWITETDIRVDGVRAFDLTVPAVISEAETAALTIAGLSVMNDVSAKPVGVVASAWDEEGAAEWRAGEPAMIALRARRAASKCVVSVDGDLHVLPWPQYELDLLVALNGLAVGSHDVTITLLAPESEAALADGSLLVTIRDPQVPLDVGTSGQGIRIVASPARPTLAELWDGRASLLVDGPPHSTCEFSVILRGAHNVELGRIRRHVELPMSTGAWTKFAKQELQGRGLRSRYDEAESCELMASRAGVGFASLVCDRGFRPLRWVVVKRHDGGYAGRLIDRTDSGKTLVEFFPVESPLIRSRRTADEQVAGTPPGGLLRAVSGSVESSVILPPDPNQLRAIWTARPVVRVGTKSPDEVIRLLTGHRRWLVADLPADPFAKYQQQRALDAMASALISLIAGPYWADLERRISPNYVIDHLDEMQALVGVKAFHQVLAKRVADHLWLWADSSETLRTGFAEVIASYAAHSGLHNPSEATRFLLELASTPGRVMDWPPPDRDRILKHIVEHPLLIRAARFAVLGTEALRASDAKSSAGGIR